MENIRASNKVGGEIRISRLPNQEKAKNIPSFAESISLALGSSTSQLLDTILIEAIDLGVSDIHFETKENDVKIRLRVDGVLQDLITINKVIYNSLLSRLKLVSGIKLNISNRPQDGRFSIVAEETNGERQEIEVRSSTLPSEYGESIVLRVLNPKNLISLEKLGLNDDLLKIFRREITKPNGMIIVTGPTGSGKTTTLYAFLKEVNNSEVKIITIEDPIEYRLEGISQTQTDPEKGYSFASGLKAIVRQDPDIILVGEIRDLETAEIALQAALTGHLVFSTLHANDAAGTIARLIDLGAKAPSVSSAINLVVAQRLLRRVCPECAKMESPDTSLLKRIRANLKGAPEQTADILLEKTAKVPVAVGCQNCSFTGYRGRIGVFETFLIDEEMEKFILQKPSTGELKTKAKEKGMITMYQDGLIKVLQGLTTISELEHMIEE